MRDNVVAPKNVPYITELSYNATVPATHQNILLFISFLQGVVIITFGEIVKVPSIINTH